MNILTKAFVYIRSIIKWIFNRDNWRTIVMGLELSIQLSEFTKNKKIAEYLKSLLFQFNKITQGLSDKDKVNAAKKITESKGIIEDLKIEYDTSTKDISGSLGPVKVTINPETNDQKFTWSLG